MTGPGPLIRPFRPPSPVGRRERRLTVSYLIVNGLEHRNPRLRMTLALPTFLQVEPVGQCNLRCQMCPIQFRKDGPPYGPPAFMDFDVFTRLIDQFPDLKELQLQGLGEPMMHPRFFDMIAYAVARGIAVSTNTNLTLLTARRAELASPAGWASCTPRSTGRPPRRMSASGSAPTSTASCATWKGWSRRDGGSAARRRTSAWSWWRCGRTCTSSPTWSGWPTGCSIDSIFVQHLCHDFGESSLPAQYGPMREFVEDETLRGRGPGADQALLRRGAVDGGRARASSSVCP